MTLTERIKATARELGFSMAGIVPAAPSPQLDAYLRWVDSGMHGEMGYMARPDRVARRRDLSVVLPGAQSMVVVGVDYFTLRLPAEVEHDPLRGRISNYAWGLDYHDEMLPRLDALAGFIRSEAGGAAARTYVDTGAILERSHAAEAGLGFTGKNTLLIHPQRGSYLFLGEVITDAALTPDTPPEMPGCGTCTRCLSACPTNAFPAPYVLDARRCISYLTIELKGWIPWEMRPLMGRWVYGCDVCQQVCPWQRFAQPAPPPWAGAFSPASVDRAAPPLVDLLRLDHAAFEETYAGSPIQRVGRDRLVRNACVAAGNSGQQSLAPQLAELLHDASSLVRGHAAWALGELRAAGDTLAEVLRGEEDSAVRAELDAALHVLRS